MASFLKDIWMDYTIPGWQGDPRQARLGYTTAVILCWAVVVGTMLPYILDGSIRELIPKFSGCSFNEKVEHTVACMDFLFDIADELMELLDIL